MRASAMVDGMGMLTIGGNVHKRVGCLASRLHHQVPADRCECTTSFTGYEPCRAGGCRHHCGQWPHRAVYLRPAGPIQLRHVHDAAVPGSFSWRRPFWSHLQTFRGRHVPLQLRGYARSSLCHRMQSVRGVDLLSKGLIQIVLAPQQASFVDAS